VDGADARLLSDAARVLLAVSAKAGMSELMADAGRLADIARSAATDPIAAGRVAGWVVRDGNKSAVKLPRNNSAR
jgi:hypothetical protein